MKSSNSGSSVMGADVGFGNLKISCSASGGGGDVRECVLPAGAQRMSEWDSSSKSLDGGEAVFIPVEGEAEEWIAGIEPRLLNRTSRVLNDQYPRSPEYAAMYAAGLVRSGLTRIDLLVTGLPVKQFYGMNGVAMRNHVKQAMSGRHHVSPRCTVEVGDVVVVPQPVGTFTALLQGEPAYARLRNRIKSLTTLCLDVGFGTVDWVLLGGNVVKPHSSHSSARATSHLLEDAARRVSKEIGRAKSRDVLDEALRNGRDVLEVGLDTDVDFRRHIQGAAEDVAGQVMDEVKNSLRLNEDLDLIILTGGGAAFYEAAAKEAFPNTDVARPENPVLANARGYRLLAEMELRRRNNAKVA